MEVQFSIQVLMCLMCMGCAFLCAWEFDSIWSHQLLPQTTAGLGPLSFRSHRCACLIIPSGLCYIQISLRSICYYRAMNLSLTQASLNCTSLYKSFFPRKAGLCLVPEPRCSVSATPCLAPGTAHECLLVLLNALAAYSQK